MRRSKVKCLAALAMVLTGVTPASARPVKVGEQAPKFTITTFDNRKIKLEELRGKVIIINYWATWCGPCKREMPLLDVFHRKLKDKGLEVFSITTEDSVPKRQLREVESLLSFPLASSLRGSGYGIQNAVPTNYVIDRNGIVRHSQAGAFELDELNALVLPLLREPAPN